VVADVRQPPRLSLLRTIAAIGVATAGAALALALTNEGVGGIQIGLLEWISVPYIAAGLIAWRRRPDSRLGVLMIAGGFTTALSALGFAGYAVPHTVGLVFDILPVVIFLHVYLAFPEGRLRSSFERGLVGGAYISAIGLQILKMSLGGVGPDNLLELSLRPDAAQLVERIQLVSISAICLAGIGVLATRRRRAGRPLRRPVALLIDSFAIGLLMVAVLFVSGAFQGPAFVPIQRATLLVIGISPVAFLVGLLDARLARSAIGELFVELRSGPSPRGLRDALARALRDPSLTLAYWLPEFATWADLDGRPLQLPGSQSGRSTTLIDRDGNPMAALLHDPGLEEEPELLSAVGAAAAIALENARLQAEQRANLEELKGSRARVIEAGQKERQRLERNLHDGAQQRLVALSLQLSMLQRHLAGDGVAANELERARGEIAASLDELRAVARGLHPAVLSGHGLEVALQSLVAHAPAPVQLSVTLHARLPEQIEVAAYYVVSESLANIGKHARAAAVSVTVWRAGDLVVIEVTDDGIGGADSEGGSGLRGLADRVEANGGRLRVWSPAGDGTRVRAEMPCE
jgi:signal transduction histidine kinase